MKLSCKSVAYVGGIGGIGLYCCKRMLERNIKALTILDLKEDCKRLDMIQESNPEVKVNFKQLDLLKGKDVIKKAVEETASEMDGIDILVNGSGIVKDRNPEATVGINFLGLIQTTLAAYPIMSKADCGKGGRMVHVASVLGLAAGPHIAIYCATKHGVIGLHRCLSDPVYYEHTGISHIAICPGYTTDTYIWDSFGQDPNEVETSTFEFSQPLIDKLADVQTQTADENACNMVEAIEKGENGTIWICDLAELKEVKLTTYWEHPFGKKGKK